jgi:hypothetical protein
MRGRAASASVTVVVVLLTAGCTAYGGLRSVVEQAAPPDAARVGECQEYGVFGVFDDAAYGCAWFAPGTRGGVTRGIASRLEERGFETHCHLDSSRGVLELSAEHGEIILQGEVSGPGSVITMSGMKPLNIFSSTRFITSDHFAAPPAKVIVKLTAMKDAGTVRRDWPLCRGR